MMTCIRFVSIFYSFYADSRKVYDDRWFIRTYANITLGMSIIWGSFDPCLNKVSGIHSNPVFAWAVVIILADFLKQFSEYRVRSWLWPMFIIQLMYWII